MMAETKKCYAWIGPSNGYAVINWHADGPQKYDWVGLYSDQSKGMNDYLTYQWVSKGSSYVTSNYIFSGLSVRYFTWNAALSESTDDSSVKLDEVDSEGKHVVTPLSLLAALSGAYTELMRSRDLDLEREVNAAGEYALKPGCWVDPSSKGYAVLNWTKSEHPGASDWVALYSDVNKGNGDYIAWQWASATSPYETSQSYAPGIHARYIKEGSSYIALRRSKPIAKGYFDLENIYNISGEMVADSITDDNKDIQKILRIMVDQLSKAVKGEDSVFSPGIWPFGNNLLFKNLSYEEVKVIAAELSPTQYYDVLMVYYETYLMAIQIADDGERNAKRHAFWQISLVQKFGEDFAVKLGDAHEKGRPGTAEDNRVDALNNAASLKYAKENPGVDPRQAADTMWLNGLLKGYNPSVAPEHTKDEL
jgi:hypothetical protein